MEKKELRKFLAGLSIASLIAGAGLSAAGCASTA
ncbi:MAG: selenobiotic family radical SAM modification target peptide [Deltaproteobacteria bacterium]|jgi:radical SAM modification target selenobiotic family peptide|nr:selenobiotic family radical SAM modification target peptide [Deltaproteobacteria bacterium]MBW2484264.1 selenobiotic family radical SAM modification target peptide [Deltaproteobacteria bacterium]